MSENLIRTFREARGLSLDGLAKRIGTTNQQVSHLELGKRRLTTTWLLRLAEALECDPLELLGISREPSLSEQEQLLIEAFRKLSPDQQEALLNLAGTITGGRAQREGRRRGKAAKRAN